MKGILIHFMDMVVLALSICAGSTARFAHLWLGRCYLPFSESDL